MSMASSIGAHRRPGVCTGTNSRFATGAIAPNGLLVVYPALAQLWVSGVYSLLATLVGTNSFWTMNPESKAGLGLWVSLGMKNVVGDEAFFCMNGF